jgi:hypothetical protein
MLLIHESKEIVCKLTVCVCVHGAFYYSEYLSIFPAASLIYYPHVDLFFSSFFFFIFVFPVFSLQPLT